MPLRIKHAFVSSKPAVGGSDKVQGTHWDAYHTIEDSAAPGVAVVGTFLPVGAVIDFDGHTNPTGFLDCGGQEISSLAYAALFAALVKSAPVTVAPGTPTVISWAAHGLRPGDTVRFTGTRPAEIGAGKYYILSAGYAAGSFRVSAAWEGAEVVATTAGSGVVAIHAPHGARDDLTFFNAPDHRSAVLAGVSNMGGTTSPRMATGYGVGDFYGSEFVVLNVTQMPSHAHGGVSHNQNANHTHAVSGSGGGSGVTDAQGNHQHSPYDRGEYLERIPNVNAPTNGSRTLVQIGSASEGSGIPFVTTVDGAHQHNFSVAVSISGATGNDLQVHAHGITAEGGGLGHPNVQPTQFTRKLIYAGM